MSPQVPFRAPTRRKRGWISANVEPTGLQARIKVAGEEHSRWFALEMYGGREGARRAASAWLDSISAELPSRYATNLRQHVSVGKRTGLPLGITESHARLRSGNTSLRLQVLWHDGKHKRIKSFTVGTDATITPARYRAARKRAVAFRHAYEQARRQDQVFDAAQFEREHPK